MPNLDAVTLYKCKAIHETDRALLVDISGEEKWVPKSVIDDDSEVYEDGHVGRLVVAGWWAEKEGF